MSLDLKLKKDVLITTPIEEAWGNKSKNILLLGLWCKTLDNVNYLEDKDYDIHNYHRNDPSNLSSDYDYLEKLYEKVIIRLAEELNNYHNTSHSLRYWRIITGTWLLTFIPIIWDRWESLSTAFQTYSFNETIILEIDKNMMIPSDFSSFNKIHSDDLWNHFIFSEIINYRYSSELNIIRKPMLEDYTLEKVNDSKQSLKNKVLHFIDFFFSKIQKSYKVLLINSYFDLKTLLKISIRLKQLPRRHDEFLEKINYDPPTKDRFSMAFNIDPENDFENYLQEIIFSQIPIAYLEGFSNLQSSANTIRSQGNIIFTANAHITNDLFNCFAANHVNSGGSLIVSQHGGALKANYGNIFNHQENISDAMTVWHKPFLKKHKKMSPSKLIGLKIKPNEKAIHLSLIAFETSNYSYRIQASPVASSFKKDYDQKIEFAKQLSEDVYPHLLIQARRTGKGWTNSCDLYANDLGEEKISPYTSAPELYDSSKVIVCTYPMTSFSEAMHLNIPTILLYLEDYWPAHPQFDNLIQILKENNIIFSDPKAAADHINNIWHDPQEWWLANSTLLAKEYFSDMCGKVSEDPIDEWVNYFNSKNL